MTMLDTAIIIATKAHSGQIDKNQQPYILHPLAVASKLDLIDLKIVALLHDTLEDTFVTKEYLLEHKIPPELVELIDTLTHKKDETYKEYIQRIKQNPLATEVKIADLSHNLDPSRASGLTERHKLRYTNALNYLKEKTPS